VPGIAPVSIELATDAEAGHPCGKIGASPSGRNRCSHPTCTGYGDDVAVDVVVGTGSMRREGSSGLGLARHR